MSMEKILVSYRIAYKYLLVDCKIKLGIHKIDIHSKRPGMLLTLAYADSIIIISTFVLIKTGR